MSAYLPSTMHHERGDTRGAPSWNDIDDALTKLDAQDLAGNRPIVALRSGPHDALYTTLPRALYALALHSITMEPENEDEQRPRARAHTIHNQKRSASMVKAFTSETPSA